MKKLWIALQGWKTVIGYILANVLGSYPMLVQAINDVIADPSRQNIINVAIQILLLVGVSNRVLKNIK